MASFHSNSPAKFDTLLHYLRAQKPLVENLILALWVVAVIISTLNHEMWRDEVRSLNLVMSINSFSEFIEMAKYDGHPILWRSILTVFYTLVPNPVILQVASLVIGFLSVWLLIKYSPLPLWIKTLFIFGVVPFGTNTVMARDYGITMLLFFLFAILVTREKQRPLLVGLVLCLAANTNSYGMYMSGLFLGYWILVSGLQALKNYRYILAIGMVVAGVLFSHWSTRVDIDTVFMTPEFLAQIDFQKSILRAILHPGEHIQYMLNLDLVYRDIFMVVLIVGLLAVNPWLGLTVLAGVVMFNFVGGAVIHPKLRHQGVLLGFIITAYWIAKAILESSDEFRYRRLRKLIYHIALIGFFVPFLVINITYTINGTIEEYRVDKSSALALGRYIESNVQLQKCIIIGEPDYSLQTISYYSNNPIYLVREKRFAPYVKYSKEFQKPMRLSQLLETAKDLYDQHKVPILIVLGFFDISEKEPRTENVFYRGTFEMSAEDIREFKDQTLKLAEFNNSLGDEDYQLFLYAAAINLERYQDKYMNLR